jgi:hypothetical protein
MSEDKVPFEVIDEYPDTMDLTSVTGQDVIDAARNVVFSVKNVEPRLFKDESTGAILTAKLNIQFSIGAMGTDGMGKYKGKVLFQEILTYFNPEVYTKEWWKKNALFPYKMFLKSLGFDPAKPPKVNDEFVSSLKGRELIADIRKVETSVKDKSTGEYVKTGEFKNELTNFKKLEG